MFLVIWWMSKNPYAAVFENRIAAEAAANVRNAILVTFKDAALQDTLTKKYHANASKINFHAFGDLEENVRTQVERIRTNPFIPKNIPVTGFVYDVKSGKLNRVT